MIDGKYNILFLCTGNSARSIIAEAIMNRTGAGRFAAYSAGSHPRGQVNPHAIALLQRLDYDTGDFRSKSWEEFSHPDSPPLHFVITVCDDAAGEVCPIWPGQPMTAHWGMPDPAAVEGSEAETRFLKALTTVLSVPKSAVPNPFTKPKKITETASKNKPLQPSVPKSK